MSTHFYDLVPRGLEDNLRWRIRCRERALVDQQFRDALIQACENDVLFFFGFALWVEEPRERIKLRPFIPWPHQESVIVGMDETITEGMTYGYPVSATVKKSRAQGGTYTYLGVQIRRALFENGFSSGLVSRNEKMMDSKDPSAVMNKLSSMLDKLPVWMLDKYERNITDHTIKLPKTNSIWVGYSATADVARGGRTSMFAFDEVGSEEFIAGGVDFKIMSSVAHVTNCVFLCSTFGADAGVFYESATDPDNPRVYSLDWKNNPVHAKHAYVRQNGVATAVRPEDQEAVDEYIKKHSRELRAIERRGHVIEGKFRSPWYDSHCILPGATPRFIARELDMDAKGAASKCFQPSLLERMKKEHCKRPVWQGVPVIDKERPEVVGLSPRDDGPLRLWFRPGIDFSPPLGPYTAGCDVASGGMSAVATPSVISMLDNSNGEQVLEYAIKGVEPRAFAFTVVAICMWMRKALLGWEDAGNSGGFADEIAKLGYWNVFYRTSEQFGSQTKTRRVGWPVRRDSDKADLFDRISMAMDAGLYIPRSEEMITECGEYEWDGDKLVHVPTKNKGAGNKNHADRAISAAGCWYIFSSEHANEKVDSDTENGQNPEIGSFLWRERQERRSINTGSPKYGIRDVLRK